MTVNYKEMIENANARAFNVRDDLQGMELDSIKLHQPKLGFAVCLLYLAGSLNIGTCVRSSVIFGANRVYIAGRKRYDRRSTVGAYNYIDIVSLPHMISEEEVDVRAVIADIVKDGYTPVLCETGGASLGEFKWPHNPCVILGSEGAGIPADIVAESEYVVGIEMPGILRSLNVSSAASIVLYNLAMSLS
jgi:tRNA G18 (ribose-2'-O)-methylase SpoU